MTRKKTVFALFAVLVLASACEKLLFEPDEASNDPRGNFNYLWNEIDKKYSYFELKNLDWDSVYTVYDAQVHQGMSDDALFEVLGNMMTELRDDHSNLISPFNISRYDLELQRPVNYSQRTIEEHYMPKLRITGPFRHDLIPGTNIAYVRYSSFQGSLGANQLSHILGRYRQTDGLILDLRQNGGGNVLNIPIILERFVSERIQAAATRTRNGADRNSFSEPAPVFLNPSSGTRYLKPVVVLIDRGSYSATTFFSLMCLSLPQITLMGDTTGGGGGLPNGGQLPNGWTYRFSITQLLDTQGNIDAEKGVPPHIAVSFDWSDLERDEILERAIVELQ